MLNFTPRAAQVLALARKESDRFHHGYTGTEHLLLGLLVLGEGVAVDVLHRMGVTLEAARAKVEELVGLGSEGEADGKVPYTRQVKIVLALAGKEAKTAGTFLYRGGAYSPRAPHRGERGCRHRCSRT